MPKNLENTKYTIAPASEWMDSISNDEIVSLVSQKEKNQNEITYENERSNICYLSNSIYKTSDDKNEDYVFLVYRLDSAELIQQAAVNDYALNKDQKIIFHRLGVVRDSIFIDKLADQNVRILDNEQASSQGSTYEAKKVNCIIDDLRIGDIFILEYNIVTNFSEISFMDKKYCRIIYQLPQNNWLYKNYRIKIIQNRTEDILVKKRFFRDSNKKIIHEEHILRKGESYIFEEVDFRPNFEPQVFSPFLEIVTKSSWEDISNYIYDLYEPILKQKNGKESELLKKIINSSDDIDIKIAKIIEYVQDYIIYVYDSEAMHGHIPQTSEKTLATQKGDCKAKSLLLVHLLEEIGIKSSLILVNYELNFYAPWELPSPFIFDHVIVKLYLNNKEYYIDPTWNGRKGFLDKRSQPYFGYYLEINKNSNLQLRDQKPPSNYNVEENIFIEIKKNKGKIVVETIYRYFSADKLRREQKQNSNSYRTQAETNYHYKKLDFPVDKNVNDYINDASYKIIYDNNNDNEIKDLYTATLIKPYQGYDSNILKVYTQMNTDTIVNFQHIDSILESAVDFPRKTSVSIKSDKFINRLGSKKDNLIIDNAYFLFSNIKKINVKTCHVISEYRPKTFGPINREDIEAIKKDYKKINDSNFGIGIVYLKNNNLIFIFALIAWIIVSLLRYIEKYF